MRSCLAVVAQYGPFLECIGSIWPIMADSTHPLVPRGPKQVLKAFRWSMAGLAATWRLESAFRLEVYLFVILAPLALWLGQTGIEQAVMIGALSLVLIIEVINSAIEAVVDRWGPELNEFAGRAKDMGSAATFLAQMNVLVCWGCILWPRIAELAKGH